MNRRDFHEQKRACSRRCSCNHRRLLFAADFLGVCYITQEKTARFIPFSEETALEYGCKGGTIDGLSDITAICAEGDGHIGAVDPTGHYHTACGVRPERAEDFVRLN